VFIFIASEQWSFAPITRGSAGPARKL
jgi:hypothetical protein